MNSVPQKRNEIDPVQLEILEMLPLSRKQKDELIMLLLSEKQITEQHTEQADALCSSDTPEPQVSSCSIPESHQH